MGAPHRYSIFGTGTMSAPLLADTLLHDHASVASRIWNAVASGRWYCGLTRALSTLRLVLATGAIPFPVSRADASPVEGQHVRATAAHSISDRPGQRRAPGAGTGRRSRATSPAAHPPCRPPGGIGRRARLAAPAPPAHRHRPR